MCYVYRVRLNALSVVLALSSLVLATPARAQEEASVSPRLADLVAGLDVVQMPQPAAIPSRPVGIRTSAERPSSLIPLYASLGVLQGLDIHSTRRGLSAGGREANPVMDSVVGNPTAFIAIKAASTVGVVWAAERLWRKEHRKTAVVLTALTNIGLAAVVAHNYRVAK